MTISKLQYITDNPLHAEAACKGGVDWVQLRIKNKGEEEWKAIALEAMRICKNYGAKIIMNDSVKLAKMIGADGVHVGKEDMPPDEARMLLGPDFIIGGTANTMEDIRRLAALKVDYIGLGPFRFTHTKRNLSPLLGLQGYVDLMKACKEENITTPVIAIGGIELDDVSDIMTTGVYGIAVSSAISNAQDISYEAGLFVDRVKKLTAYEKQRIESRG